MKTILLLLLFGFLGVCSFAQTSSAAVGVVEGVVKDPTGAVVPGATVTVTNSAGALFNAVAAERGNFRISNVTPGNYSVEAAYTGLQQRSVVLVP